jgi:hypothetical protein
MYKKDYVRFEIKPGKSLDDFFARFHKILSNLRVVMLHSLMLKMHVKYLEP